MNKMKDILVGLVLISQLTQVCLQPYYAESDGKCRNSSTEYLLDGSNLCCKKCQPGQRVLDECNESSDTVCEDCEEGLYRENWNYAPTCSSCVKCSPGKGLQYARTCSATAGSLCICQPGMYCNIGFDDPYCQHCEKYKLCRPGFGVSVEGRANSNVKCKRCPSGTFSDKESSTERCQSHTKCRGRTVREGNATSDSVCEPQSFTSSTHAQSPTMDPLTETKELNSSSVTHLTLLRGLTDSGLPHTETVESTSNPISKNTAAIAGVTGGVILMLFIVCLLFFYKAIFKKDAAILYPKLDPNANCKRCDEEINQSYFKPQMTSLTVTSTEQECMLEKGEVSSSDPSHRSNNWDAMTRTEDCNTYEFSGPLQPTVDLNNFSSVLSEPMPLTSNIDPVTPQPSVHAQSSSQPTSPQIISPVTGSPHVNVNITFHIGNGSCGAQPAIPTDLRQANCNIPFGEEDESFSMPQQEDGKQSLMSVQETTSYSV